MCDENEEIRIVFAIGGGKYAYWKKQVGFDNDNKVHSYTLFWGREGSYKVFIDGNLRVSGKVKDDFDFGVEEWIEESISGNQLYNYD